MITSKLLAIAVSAMLLIGGVAGVAAGAPGPVTDAGDEETSTVNLGPSDGLPGPVPDHVSAIHETIESFLSGGVDMLGGALNDLLAGGANAAIGSHAGDGR